MMIHLSSCSIGSVRCNGAVVHVPPKLRANVNVRTKSRLTRIVRMAANNYQGRSLDSYDSMDAPRRPQESEEVTMLRKSLFALENERDDVVKIGESNARAAMELRDEVAKWDNKAVRRMQRDDEDGAKSALRAKASASENLEKATSKAQANFSLAAKIVEKIGATQSKLVELGAIPPPPPRADTSHTTYPPEAPSYKQQQQQSNHQPSYYQPPPSYQPQSPYQQSPYQPPSYPPPSLPHSPYQPPQQPSYNQQPPYQQQQQHQAGGGSYPEIPKYEPINRQGGAARYDTTYRSSANSQPTAHPASSQPSAPSGGPLSSGYTPSAPKWQVSLEEAQQRREANGTAEPRWKVSLDEAQRRVREAEAKGTTARQTAEDRIFEAQERLRGSDTDSRESMWAQRNRMRVTSETAIEEAQRRLRGQDAEILGYARRTVEKYKRGEYVSDEQLEYAFRQLERLTY